MEQPHAYPDGTATHGKEGAVLPRSTARSQDDDLHRLPSLAGDIGATFDTHAPYPQNIIACDEKGRVVESFELTAAAVMKMREHNIYSGKKSLSFSEAAKLTSGEKVASAPLANTGVLQVQAPKSVRAAGAAAASIQSPADPPGLSVRPHTNQVSAELQELLGATRTRVRFKGSFGALSVLYSSVHRHDFYLVMVQYAEDGEFYEAPSGDQQVIVEVNGTQYTCFPGPQVPLAKDSKIMVTIYMIDEGNNG